jgi:hypothetical protein
VELYPGYPGYRGYIAGVKGSGEIACLQELIAADPSFNKDAEDAANLSAARVIGLNGAPIDWTWENWMAIEAERGLAPTCYSCLFRDDGPGPDRRMAAWDPSDPRLQMGGYGTSEAIGQAAARAGLGRGAAARLLQDMFDPDDQDGLGADHVLRALIGLTWPGHHTAVEMLDAYDVLIAEVSAPGTGFFDPGQLWEMMLDQGGYAPTPPTATLDDQLYMVRISAEAACVSMPDDTCRAWLATYGRIEGQWLTEWAQTPLDDVPSYAAWLRENVGNPF